MIMTEDMGGEVAEFIRKYKSKVIRCFGTCRKDRVMNEFKGYEHDGGLADANGNRWWVYFECPRCGYGHSHAKMDFFESHTRIEHDAIKSRAGQGLAQTAG